jgi:hypothetical protein
MISATCKDGRELLAQGGIAVPVSEQGKINKSGSVSAAQDGLITFRSFPLSSICKVPFPSCINFGANGGGR